MNILSRGWDCMFHHRVFGSSFEDPQGVSIMSVHTQAHYKAMKDLIEIMAIASALGFLADCIWIIAEITDYGIHPNKLIILLLLHVALLIQLYALYQFHNNLTKTLVNSIICEKKQASITRLRLNRKKALSKLRGVK